MESGYLGVEVNDQRPGFVRIMVSERLPKGPDSPSGDGPRLRYAARFNDRDAALMHTHEILKRRLVDADVHLYRVDEERAIAAIESLGLRHRDVFLDPSMSDATKQAIDAARRELVRQRETRDQIFTILGYAGIAILIFNLLFRSFA